MVTSLIAWAMHGASRSRSGAIDLEAELELEVRHDGDEVGVSGALAVAVDGALDVGRPGVDGRDELATAQPVSLWQWMPEPGAGRGDDVGDDLLDLVRQHAAVGVAEHDDLGPGLVRRPHD